MKSIILLLLAGGILFNLSCKKDSFLTSADARLNFSSDTLHFDTVFTTAGSTTQFVKIFNPNDQKVQIQSVRLMGGSQSPFKLNIDGAPGATATELELAAHDSLYVFVSVFVNPAAGTLPFVLQDSIEVSLNGHSEFIQLDAWGQNAHFLRNKIISSDTSFANDLPFVILGGLQIDSSATLTIGAGCRLYFHADAPFLVNGNLTAVGKAPDSARIYFSSDRLDDPYSGFPGSWPGIYFNPSSRNSLLEFAVIRNAYQGLVAQDSSGNANPKLTLNECIVDNIYDAGILGIHTSIVARNCLVSNCGSNIVIGYGGDYQFLQCTVAAFSNTYISHVQPVLTLSNYVTQGSDVLVNDLTGQFINCIFWGDNANVTDEVVALKQGNSLFDLSFDHCLWKAQNIPAGADTSGVILNRDPLFETINNSQHLYNFRLQPGSPAIDAGNPGPGIPIDLDGNPRPVSVADLGAYERQ